MPQSSLILLLHIITSHYIIYIVIGWLGWLGCPMREMREERERRAEFFPSHLLPLQRGLPLRRLTSVRHTFTEESLPPSAFHASPLPASPEEAMPLWAVEGEWEGGGGGGGEGGRGMWECPWTWGGGCGGQPSHCPYVHYHHHLAITSPRHYLSLWWGGSCRMVKALPGGLGIFTNIITTHYIPQALPDRYEPAMGSVVGCPGQPRWVPMLYILHPLHDIISYYTYIIEGNDLLYYIYWPP